MDSYFKNKYRRGQVISTYGVGALANFPDDSLIAASLDFWPSEVARDDAKKFEIEDAVKVQDERLAKRISKSLGKRIDYFLSPSEEPPIRSYERKQPQNAFKKEMPFFRFPQIYSCPHCNKIHKLDLYGVDEHGRKICKSSERLFSGKGDTCNKRSDRSKKLLVPTRYLVACQKGHLSDFPWYNWVHGNKTCTKGGDENNLFIGRGGKGYSSTSVTCNKCKQKRSLSGAEEFGALDKYFGGSCPGHMPWTGEIKDNNCKESLSLIQRGSTSLYFSNYESSILIPPYADQINLFLEKKWSDISQFLERSLVKIDDALELNHKYRENFKQFFLSKGSISNYNKDLIIDRAIERYSGIKKDLKEIENLSEEAYRYQEYETFLKKEYHDRDIEDKKNFDVDSQYSIEDYESWMSDYFDEIALVKNVQITKALIGFSRLRPNISNESHKILSINNNLNWLPGVAMTGEGIFLKFNEKKIDEWSESLNYSKIDYIKEKINKAIESEEPTFTDRSSSRISNKFLLLHTFSHMLINQIAFESGYPVSQISERLYDSVQKETKMAGILIYTSSGDSEGSLGGLFEKGKPGFLERIIKDAIKNSYICSSDPVCIETPNQGLNGYNGSACHNCSLIPDISCEERNLFLDRRTMIGDNEENIQGFFKI